VKEVHPVDQTGHAQENRGDDILHLDEHLIDFLKFAGVSE